jgi:hypothetical protein
MARALWFGALLFVASTCAFGANWSGVLVDSNCYAAKERNVDPHDTLAGVDRDKYQEFWYCSPGKKTKFFAVVQRNGIVVNLDPAANAKVEEVVREAGKRLPFAVTVTGDLSDKLVRVETISRMK